jgi:hypothetical protein
LFFRIAGLLDFAGEFAVGLIAADSPLFRDGFQRFFAGKTCRFNLRFEVFVDRGRPGDGGFGRLALSYHDRDFSLD